MATVVVGTRNVSRLPEFAGNTWAHLQYVLGFRKLGLETFWVDHLRAIDPHKHHHSLDYLMARFERTARDFGVHDRACVVYDNGERSFGLTASQLDRLAGEADLLVNINGYLPPDSPLMRIPRRVYVDLDPGFTHIWIHQTDMGIDRHNFFFTVGQNVGRPEFAIPLLGIPWEPMLPPVVLDYWPPCVDERSERFSSIADWRNRKQKAIFDGQYYGGKRDEFVRFLRVPTEVKQRIEIALCIGYEDHEDLGLLVGHNWHVREPYLVAGDPQSYREFIQFSRAELSVAKTGYVRANSGWVSDRTATYLASGKPALVQSTGFEWRLPTGKGLLTFQTVAEAVAGIEAIDGNYLRHCHAARQLAEAYFDSDLVLGNMLKRVGL
ncbi:MAG: hypothetical protein HY331_10285 [Chloroflexi bacterium]|nr:hypothetical protein [Chloroflexota bacterium]